MTALMAPSAKPASFFRTIPIFISMPINIPATPTGGRITSVRLTKLGKVTHFVAILGTSGTFVGTTRRLKELNPAIRCISLQPDSAFHGIEGAKHMESAIVPKIYDPTLADENLEIATEDAYAMTRRLARECGQLVGISAAANVVGSLQVARSLKSKDGTSAVIVTILCDSGDKYLSERFWTEE
jgi:cysteine synthase B